MTEEGKDPWGRLHTMLSDMEKKLGGKIPQSLKHLIDPTIMPKIISTKPGSSQTEEDLFEQEPNNNNGDLNLQEEEVEFEDDVAEADQLVGSLPLALEMLAIRGIHGEFELEEHPEATLTAAEWYTFIKDWYNGQTSFALSNGGRELVEIGGVEPASDHGDHSDHFSDEE